MDLHLNHVREIEAVAEGRSSARDAAVVESWMRCLTKHRLNPAARSEAYILPEAALREHRQRSEDLIAIARSGIENLYALVAGQNYVLLLADRAGVTVEYLGDEAQKQALRQSGLWLGAEWSEGRAGTCALGACIETGEALVIHQTDHFDSTHTSLSCTAAPIYDTAGRLTAVLDISLLCSPRAKASQSLALNLVQASARRIEMANLMAENRREWVLRLSRSPEFLDVDPEAALSLDGSGRVLGMTHGAARILARATGCDWRRAGDLIGRPLPDFLNLTTDRLEALTRQRPAAERFIETRDGHRLFAHAIEPRRLPVRMPAARGQLSPALRGLAGDDDPMTALLRTAAALAVRPLPISIEGETGAGKLTLARAIHDAGGAGPLVVVHCAEVGDDEALLFGRAAARRADQGLIAAAEGGTLVLHRVEELGPRVQARLMRLAAEGTYLPVGAVRPVPARLRLIATLAREAPALRADLVHRLGARLRLPALRDRADRLWLAERALAAEGAELSFSAEALAVLAAHGWPGNLRELSHLAATLRATVEGPVVRVEDLPPSLTGAPPRRAEAAGAVLAQLLRQTGGNISETARRMGVNRSTVHRQIRRLGMTR
ncbi:sigma-54-dependent Fis family transcriptional regulator [Cereibacter azotoformans]|uniref:Transcriptional regulator of acetoin/glycerol metabolism n=1 Tax=Cereibacter azotoformans TaxID=43057 RepID=A0A2T5K5M8_9RHOB|nr:sigma-54-dependent Fis family transcriptional regulator [Cereibacter azotoformans]AXQ95541.1 sigma-54-dependent Fis family transcriptional regulator [Cereibacter sphaeroides]PTR17726.1 transcriptional regulator of acetoin/glycerol metabolism [Cereibacter azotoformans]UIJ32213.1 sigma-54-dependent Fis family transcriptional regulator [Cereibacter azotoformans]